MSTPQDPFGPPSDDAPQPGQQPYGQPPAGQQYGQPPAGWGQPGQYGAPQQATGTNGMAIASLVCAFFCSPLGIIFGFIARSQIKRTGQNGDGLALAGIILSIVLLVLGIGLFALGVAAGNSGPASTY